MASTSARKEERAAKGHTATVSSKGQITIPAALMRQYAIQPGDKLLILSNSIGISLVPKPERITDLFPYEGPSVYGDAMEYIERASWD